MVDIRKLNTQDVRVNSSQFGSGQDHAGPGSPQRGGGQVFGDQGSMFRATPCGGGIDCR